MKIQIIKGWTNGKEEYRVYENQKWIKQFETYEEAFSYKMFIHAMERASIADDEQVHRVDDSGNIIFKHEKGAQ